LECAYRESGFSRFGLDVENIIVPVAYAQAYLIGAVFSDIPFGEEIFHVQSEYTDKVGTAIAVFLPGKIEVEGFLSGGDGDMIMVLEIIVSCPATVFMQE